MLVNITAYWEFCFSIYSMNVLLFQKIGDQGLLHQNGLLPGLEWRQLFLYLIVGPSLFVKIFKIVIAVWFQEATNVNVHQVEFLVLLVLSMVFAQFLYPHQIDDAIQIQGISIGKLPG